MINQLILLLCAISLTTALSAQRKKEYRKSEILWDTYGIPHIYAKNDQSLFYAYGWAQAKNHGNLVLRLYAQARGRGAEYFGETFRDNDVWTLTNNVYSRAQQWYRLQKPNFRENLDAFATGINDYAAANPALLSEDAKRVLPVNAVDVLAHMHRITHFMFVTSSARAASAISKYGEQNGSNAWAIAPSRSASGNTLLLANPHLPWRDFYIYFEAQLTAPGINAYGISRIGFPVLTMAFNEFAGYSQTVNTNDGEDYYELRLKDNGYILDGIVRPFTRREHLLKIRSADGNLREEKLLVRESVHGPVVGEQNGKAIALRVAGLDKPFMLEQYWEMCRAQNLGQFEASVSKLHLPMYTLMFADRSGNIFNLFNGTVPVRPHGDWKYWSGIIRGDTTSTLWTKTHPYHDLPKVKNPPTGWLQNANEPPWTATLPMINKPSDFPSYLAPGPWMSFRAQRSARMLMEDDKISLEELIEYKHSTRMELADRIADELVSAARKEGSALALEAAEVLSQWDHNTDAGSKGAILFDQFVRQWVGGNTALSSLGTGSPLFAKRWDTNDPVNTPDGLAEPEAAAEALKTAAEEVKRKYGRLDIPWGEVFRFRVAGADYPGNGGPGPMGVFRTMTPGPSQDGKYVPVHGDTHFSAVEFSTPLRAFGLTSYGNASQPGAKHATDQLPLLAEKKMRPIWFYRNEVEKNLEERTSF